jgi:hypothetical protein
VNAFAAKAFFCYGMSDESADLKFDDGFIPSAQDKEVSPWGMYPGVS